MRAIAVSILVLALTGCMAFRDKREIAWQSLHAVDALNTDTLRDDPCLYESHPLTRRLIGDEPSRASVIAWGVGGAALHAGVSEMLIRGDHPRLLSIWQWVSIADSGISVAVGLERGARPVGRNVSECAR